eukprot:553389-Pelagomonas_calceolata.AAC.1
MEGVPTQLYVTNTTTTTATTTQQQQQQQQQQQHATIAFDQKTLQMIKWCLLRAISGLIPVARNFKAFYKASERSEL